MAIGPINYVQDVQTPFEAAAKGYQFGAGIRDDQAKYQAAQIAQQNAIQMRDELRLLSQNATPENVAAFSIRYPQLSEQFKRSYDMLTEGQRNGRLQATIPVYTAALNGRPDISAQLLRDRAAAVEASGNAQEAAAIRANADMFEQHPEQAGLMGGLLLSSVMGGDKFTETFGKLGSEQRSNAAAPAEQRIKTAEAGVKEAEAAAAPEKLATDIANVKSQIAQRAAQLGLDADKLTTETQLKIMEMRQKFGEIPEAVGKDINAAVSDAMAAEQSAGKMEQLADQLQKEGGGYGGVSTAGEWLKKATGNQNEMTRLRAEYNRIVTPAAMSAYKRVASGSTSDRDIDTAMKGVPPDTADAAEMASFLRGVSKLQRYEAVVNNAKSEWLGAVKNLGKAREDIEIDGVRVPAGTTFKNFADQYVDQKIAKQTAERGAKAVQGRSYMRWAQPQQAQPAPAAGTDMRGILPATGGL